MKILIYMSNFYGGGAEKTVVNLANSFVKSGHQTQIVVNDGSGPRRQELASEVLVTDLQTMRDRNSVWPLAQVIKKARPDVCFATMSNPCIVMAMAHFLTDRSSKLVLRESNYRSHPLGNKNPIGKLLLQLAYQRADLLVSLTQAIKKDMITRYSISKEKIHVIGNPVDFHKIREQSQLKSKSNPELADWLRDHPCFVSAGRLHPQKGYDLLIPAFAKVVSEMPKARLLILGQGPQKTELTSLVEQHGLRENVLLPGYVDNPYAIMSQCQAYVFSSRWEGFGHVLIEALSCQIPVVAWNCMGVPEEILPNSSEWIKICPPEDESQLSQAMLDVLRENTRRDIASIEDHLLKFDNANIGQAYLSLFDHRQG